jgi:hypothetical protein
VKDGGRLDRSQLRVNPVPGLSGDQEVEATIHWLPLFEVAILDIHPVPTGDRRHAWIGLQAEDLATAGAEESAGDSGAASHIKHGSRVIRQEGVDQ